MVLATVYFNNSNHDENNVDTNFGIDAVEYDIELAK